MGHWYYEFHDYWITCIQIAIYQGIEPKNFALHLVNDVNLILKWIWFEWKNPFHFEYFCNLVVGMALMFDVEICGNMCLCVANWNGSHSIPRILIWLIAWRFIIRLVIWGVYDELDKKKRKFHIISYGGTMTEGTCSLSYHIWKIAQINWKLAIKYNSTTKQICCFVSPQWLRKNIFRIRKKRRKQQNMDWSQSWKMFKE